jgi:transposase
MDLRREYTRDFKIRVMHEIEAGRGITEVARELEINPRTIENWRADWRARGDRAFSGAGRPRPAQPVTEGQRIAELERKIGQLTMENDLLKKALARWKEKPHLTVLSGETACLKKSGRPLSEAKP